MPAGSDRGSPSTVSETGRPAARVLSTSASSGASTAAGRALLAVVHDAEQAAHLGQRRAPDLLDVHGGVDRPLRVAGEDPARAARLDDHHGHRVGDHVVHLARDPAALLGRCAGDLLLVRLLGLDGRLVQLLGQPRARAHAAAGEPAISTKAVGKM